MDREMSNGDTILMNGKVTWFPTKTQLRNHQNDHSTAGCVQDSESDGSKKKPSYIGISVLANGYHLRSRTPDTRRSRNGHHDLRMNGDISIHKSDAFEEKDRSLPIIYPSQNGHVKSVSKCPKDELLNHTFCLQNFSVDEQLTDGPTYRELLRKIVSQLTTQKERLGEVLGNEKHLTEAIAEDIRVAIGRTELLLNKRLRQFEVQLERHMNPVPGEKATKIDDLHGLFSLVDMQLDDIRQCFDRIEKARANNRS